MKLDLKIDLIKIRVLGLVWWDLSH